MVCRVVDALGHAIAGAELTVRRYGQQAEEAPIGPVMSEQDGTVTIPEAFARQHGTWTCRLSHPEYGSAEVMHFGSRGPDILFPLVHPQSAAFETALTGTVLGDDGHAVRRCRIRCQSIRTTGSALIQHHGQAAALTDDNGGFALYIPHRRKGVLIPPFSTYRITVTPPQGSGLFPHAGAYGNTKPAQITLQLPRHRSRLSFQRPDGHDITDLELLAKVRLTYSPPDDRRASVQLELSPPFDSVPVLPGTYTVLGLAGEYLPVTVQNPPQPDVRFCPTPAGTFQGLVRDGVTHEPLEGAIVFGYAGRMSGGNLTATTAKEWEDMRLRAPGGNADEDVFAPLRRCYTGLTNVAVTGPDGTYEIVQPPGAKLYGLVAAAEGKLGCKLQQIYRLQTNPRQHMQVPDMALFPGAYLTVTPVPPGKRLSIGYYWHAVGDDQPPWAERLPRDRYGSVQVERPTWLVMDRAQRIPVPAEMRFRLTFSTPYDNQWTPVQPQQTFCLADGDVEDVGELRFAPCPEISVRVVDEQGNPVEGVPIRRSYKGGRSWSVARNTDQTGVVQFHVRPNSSGQFAVRDMPQADRPPPAQFKAANGAAPDILVTIRMTDEQLRVLFLGKRAEDR